MDMTNYHLAQLNIGKASDDIDSDTLAPFVSLLSEINALAEGSAGFVWRLKDETGNATSISVYENPRIIVNMSVWEDVKSLQDYVYKSAHTEVMARRRDWFEVMKEAYHVLWWVKAGTKPTMILAKERLDHLQRHGPSEFAFTFKSQFSQPKAA